MTDVKTDINTDRSENSAPGNTSEIFEQSVLGEGSIVRPETAVTSERHHKQTCFNLSARPYAMMLKLQTLTAANLNGVTVYCKTRNVGATSIIFGGFENITIWQRFNLEFLFEESGWGPYFFHLVTTNFGEIY